MKHSLTIIATPASVKSLYYKIIIKVGVETKVQLSEVLNDFEHNLKHNKEKFNVDFECEEKVKIEDEILEVIMGNWIKAYEKSIK